MLLEFGIGYIYLRVLGVCWFLVILGIAVQVILQNANHVVYIFRYLEIFVLLLLLDSFFI